jgi:hypothetical protein
LQAHYGTAEHTSGQDFEDLTTCRLLRDALGDGVKTGRVRHGRLLLQRQG